MNGHSGHGQPHPWWGWAQPPRDSSAPTTVPCRSRKAPNGHQGCADGAGVVGRPAGRARAGHAGGMLPHASPVRGQAARHRGPSGNDGRCAVGVMHPSSAPSPYRWEQRLHPLAHRRGVAGRGVRGPPHNSWHRRAASYPERDWAFARLFCKMGGDSRFGNCLPTAADYLIVARGVRLRRDVCNRQQ